MKIYTTKSLQLLVIVFLSLNLGASAYAVATITIVNGDAPGVGFNDPTPFTPVGGNPATTLGKARLLAVRHAANLWGSQLNSDVDIKVRTTFEPLPCNEFSIVLGSAGPTSAHRNFFGAEQADTWYVQALANSLSETDLNPTSEDAVARFNSRLGTESSCLPGVNWYYGVNGDPETGEYDLVSVAFHELSHSLGFISLADCESTGQKLMGYDDVYSNNLLSLGESPDQFSMMTDAQRLDACRNDPNLVWSGPAVTAAQLANPLLEGVESGRVRMHAPTSFSGGSSVSHFSEDLAPNELMEPRYDGVNHQSGLALELMEDIGWNIQPSFGVDIVFLMDLTGSTGALIGGWLDQIPKIANSWRAFDTNARFALATHRDYPFFPHAHANEWAYRVESTFSPSVSNLMAALANVTDEDNPPPGTGGIDEPESQYEAILQVLTGEGRELEPPVNFTDPGEIPMVSLGQLAPMVIYHFTSPPLFHDRDQMGQEDYPKPGAFDSREGIEIPGSRRVLETLAETSGRNIFFGLTLIDGEPELSPAALGVGGDTPNPLIVLADLTGGEVYNVGNDLVNLGAAIDASIGVYTTSSQAGDSDSDGLEDSADNCPYIANAGQSDFDEDGVGDACDNCIGISNVNQTDLDLNGAGDVCNCVAGNDADGDNICDVADLCPNYAQSDLTQLDTDEDGYPNECECGDFNLDGLVNTVDARLIQRCAIGEIDCALPLCDANNDGVCNTLDARIVQRFFRWRIAEVRHVLHRTNRWNHFYDVN